MNLFPRHSLNHIKWFVANYSHRLFFTALFYAIWLVSFYLKNTNLELTQFDGRMISSATIHGLDIAQRVSVFYKSLGVLALAFILFNVLGYFINKIKTGVLSSNEFKAANYTSLVGLLYFLFIAFGFKVDNSIEFIYFIHKLMVAAFLIKLGFKNNLSIPFYTVTITIALSLYYFVADVMLLFGSGHAPDFLMYSFIIAVLMIIFFQTKLKGKTISEKHHLVLKVAYNFMPLVFLPLLSVLKDEIGLILIGNGTEISDFSIIYFCIVILFGLLVYLRHLKFSKKRWIESRLSIQKIIATRYFPGFIFSVVSYTFYSHFIEGAIEMSEAANKYLPVMEFKNWGIVPGIEKLNSHLLSDYFFSFLYSFFNNFKTNELELYDFLNISFYVLFSYYVIYFITRNAYMALFVVLFYPFFYEVLPSEHSFAILTIVILAKLLNQKATLKSYILFFIGIFFLTLWRLDVGVACVFSAFIILLLYTVFVETNQLNYKVFFQAFASVSLVFFSLILILAAIRKVNIFEKAKYALNYFSSAQTYGYIYIGNTKSPIYITHYFVFPIIAALVIIFLIYKFKPLTINKGQRLSLLSLFFITTYYFINFQRGLIRHSLFEGTDVFVASFIYLIFALSCYVFFFKKSQVFKFVIFNGVLFFLVINYKVPAAENSETVFERNFSKMENASLPPLEVGESRSKKCDYKGFENVIDFLKTELDSTQTFVDFTNTPMLYYFTNKITPSYFFQNPVCSHNELLQNGFIEDLKNYNVPYLLFSRIVVGENTIDGIQNSVRHYRIAEYIFNNYKPYVIKDDYCIWIKNGVVPEAKQRLIYNFENVSNDSIRGTENYKITFNADSNKTYLIKLVSKKSLDNGIIFAVSAGQNLLVKVNTINAPQTIGYCCINPKGKECAVYIKDPSTLINLEITECTDIPDYLSQRFMSYDIKKLAHIWGTYDKNYRSEATLFEDNKAHDLGVNKNVELAIPTSLDKSSGNTLVFKIKNSSKKIQTAIVSIANKINESKADFVFEVTPSDSEEVYAIRLSSAFNWYNSVSSKLILSSNSAPDIKITTIKLTKGK